MAIQNRRGQYADFNPSKAVPGELLTVLSGDPNSKDGKAVYMTFASGDVKRMATYEDMVDNIEAATEDVAQDVADQIEENLQPMVTTAQTAAQTATTKANEASQSASSVSASAAQIATNKNDISDLKSAIDNNLYKKTSNMLDFGFIGGTWEQGGHDNSNPYMCRTKINVSGGETLYGVINNSKMIKTPALSTYNMIMYVRAFDSSDAIIGDAVMLSTSLSQVTTPFTAPQDTSYVLIILSTGAWGNQLTPSTLDNAVEAFAYFGYDNINYTEVKANYSGYPDYNNGLIQNIDDEISKIQYNIPSTRDIESIAAGGYKTLADLPSGTMYNWSNTSTALSPDVKIANAYKLNKCSFNVATAGSFAVGLYTVNGDTATVTHLQEITATETGAQEFELEFALDETKEYYWFILPVTGAYKFAVDTKTNKYYTLHASAISVGGTGTITTVGNGLAIGTFNVLLNISVSDGVANVVTVAKSGGDYQTIQEAVNNTTTETIIVYPGVYDEVVIVPNSGGRNIIGVDRERCIIRSKSGKYVDAPLKIYGAFYLANMTLIATAEDAGSWYPTWDSSDNTTFASYAIHIEGRTSDWNGTKGIARNCTFYSECSHAAGCGVQKGYTLEFENCEFIRNVTDEHYLSSNYDGAMGVHSPNVNETGATGEHLIMRDCTMINKNHLKALQLFHVYLGASLDAEIKGCTFKDSAGIDNVIKFWNCTNAIITNMSHGNSTDECNYRVIHQ